METPLRSQDACERLPVPLELVIELVRWLITWAMLLAPRGKCSVRSRAFVICAHWVTAQENRDPMVLAPRHVPVARVCDLDGSGFQGPWHSSRSDTQHAAELPLRHSSKKAQPTPSHPKALTSQVQPVLQPGIPVGSPPNLALQTSQPSQGLKMKHVAIFKLLIHST